jgi:hypothetical protein
MRQHQGGKIYSKAFEWLRVAENGREWLGMVGNGREWLGMAGNGWEWLGMAGNGWELQGMVGNGREWQGGKSIRTFPAIPSHSLPFSAIRMPANENFPPCLFILLGNR